MNNLFELVLDKILGKKISRLKYVNTNIKGDYVILLHGLNRSARSMEKLENALAEEGYSVINQSYPSRKYNIDILASSFLDKIIKTYCVNKKKKIHFVTHSLGGIILRRYLQKKPILNMGRTVMIAPPNHGTKWVDFIKKTPFFIRWALGKAGRQLGKKHSILSKLPKKANFELAVIAATHSYNTFSSFIFKTKNDGTVTVNDTKLLGMKDFIEVTTTHCIAPRNEEVIKHTVNFINYGHL